MDAGFDVSATVSCVLLDGSGEAGVAELIAIASTLLTAVDVDTGSYELNLSNFLGTAMPLRRNASMINEQAELRKSGYEVVAPELTLSETLRVLEVARGMQQGRAQAEVALARTEIRAVMRKRLLEAAAITGDRMSEADVDAAIEQYFSTQHAYQDPPSSFGVFLAHAYIRRMSLAMMVGVVLVIVLMWRLMF